MSKNIASPILLISGFVLLGAVAVFARSGPANAPGPLQQQGGPARQVDLVIALDTSSSMDGLIDAARQKLWDTVNLLAQARPQPVLRVGLVSYGNDGYDAARGWVRKDSDLTTDLDGIYAKLFALRTGGGTEYVARALTEATERMEWRRDQQTLKIVFVAGNEPANQDPQIPLEQAVRRARAQGIFVNTIYCGSPSAGEAGLWQTAATLAGGQFAAIDQDSKVAVATPMDAELARLSQELNRTYVAYGSGGALRAMNQAAQDKNAMMLSAPVAAARAVAKSSALYSNEEWDLVDARKKGKADVASLKPAELPAELQGLDAAGRQAYLDKKAAERQAIQKQIAELSGKREQYLRAERVKMKHARAGKAAFDDAVEGSIKKEAEAMGLAF